MAYGANINHPKVKGKSTGLITILETKTIQKEKMKIAYLFDIDGTLTPPTQKMQGDFVYSFLDWSSEKDFFLVNQIFCFVELPVLRNVFCRDIHPFLNTLQIRLF